MSKSMSQGISEIEEVLDSVDQRFQSFKKFDVAISPPRDHHYFMFNQPINPGFLWSLTSSKGDKKLRDRVEKEWEMLKAKLPNSIFVRAYEDKCDLMRAVIICLEGGPCSYGLFFFDIFFPKDYPLEPPVIFHHSGYGGPNLNTTFSCIKSDTNSCTSRGLKFKWNPKTSNIYQVLSFIQGYVLMTLNDDDKVFFLSQRAMLSILSSSPMGFEDFVKGYFRKYSHAILMQIKGRFNLSESQLMTKLFFNMLLTFEANGSYCKHLVHGVEREITSPQESLFSYSSSLLENSQRNSKSPGKMNGLNRLLETISNACSI